MKSGGKIAAITAAAALSFAGITAANADDEITVTLNGVKIGFDVPPQLIEDRTMVPLRAIFEAMDAGVDWDNDTQTVTAVKDGTTVKMTIGNSEISVNEKKITLDVPPQLVGDRTLVPARAVAESFGAKVDWDDSTQTVIITTEEKPTVMPTVSPTPAPTAAPEPAKTDAIPIEYDIDSTTSDSVKGFRIDSYTVDANGDYNVNFYVETYLEGPGSVAAYFDCIDKNGKVLAVIGDTYRTVDYQFTPHKDTAVIPAGTVRLALSGKK